MKKLISTLLIALVGGAASIGLYKLAGFDKKEIVFNEVMGSPSSLTRFGSGNLADFTTVAEKANPAVVHIKATFGVTRTSTDQRRQPQSLEDLFDLFGGGGGSPFGDRGVPQQGAGSGVIIGNDGYIVTNNHVVDNAEEVEVTLYDNRSYKGTIIGTDPSTDLALVKINEKDLPTLAFANSDAVKVGEWVMAVGNPFNLTSTVTAGIVSAKGRNINILRNKDNSAIESFIQTDAAVNPGNSGGALVNMNGDLVGINTAIASQTGSFAGYSFAVPANLVKKVTEDLKKFGTVQRGFLGIIIRNLDSKLAKELDLNISEGIYVDSLVANGSAAVAGVKSQDVITRVDGTPVKTVPELQELVGRHRPGDVVTLMLVRDGKEREIKVTLKTRDGSTEVAKKTSQGALDVLGIEVEKVSDKESKQLDIQGGVKVTAINRGKISKFTDMKEGFIITRIGNKVIKNPQDVNKALEGVKGGIMIEGIYPDGEMQYYAFGMD
ncbi:MAG: Do family serine endopeptidase [Cytophagales bacterium]|nr:MAG: Do family serine endopeptidase [Cytophagales bacterium]